MKNILPIIIGIFISGCKTQLIKTIETYPDGKINIEYIYPNKNDTSNFTYKQFYESGKLMAQSEVKENKFIGSKIAYYENGKIHQLGTLCHPVGLYDSIYDCDETTYREDGIIESKFSYRNKSINGLVTYYDSSGRIDTTETFVNGHLNGKAIVYYQSGKIEIIRNYINDMPVGFEYDFLENGDTLRASSDWGYSDKDGVRYKKWLKSGLILTESYGDSTGSFRIWKWVDKNNEEVKRYIEKGKITKDGYREFIAPE